MEKIDAIHHNYSYFSLTIAIKAKVFFNFYFKSLKQLKDSTHPNYRSHWVNGIDNGGHIDIVLQKLILG